MDINFTPEEEAFREEVRAFLKEKLPENVRQKVLNHKHLTKDDLVNWQKTLYEKGWAAPGWPKKHGGPGWTPVQKAIFDEETALAGAPPIIPFGLSMVAPVIMNFGSEEQKERFLPGILSSDDWWCQGYSEPGAGSDLASLKTRAERKGDKYIVNGQKTWTTLGQYADWIFCLVRTDPEAKKQEGISFLLIDMNSPGITVRPIITLDGGHEVNEVFFDNVEVPADNLVGEENKGWTYAKFLLGHERSGIAGVGRGKMELRRLKEIAAKEQKNGRPLIEDTTFRSRVAQIEMELDALEMTDLRVIAAVQHGQAPGPEASMLKIKGTEIRQEIYHLIRQAVGPYALPFQPEALGDEGTDDAVAPDYCLSAAPTYFNNRKLTIFGGSNEIQKNIVSKMILGL
ncbi:acyl-CoA dehydrogenase family protein [Aquisalimonas asiatica]|uniref:Pimeloyl-CoA dehydrogenase, large subunit n=1 Tax=Aquisalimonas asiatica TaxID=406100 RepID=A0A1H8S1J6_9GAMM|nr:acyl-CoA dehydrogenase family protein [Aquisalimonas asiatica]SEO72218.1 pimeloyl-CoA dehydrogenase, large subunit [Aquisalimonas asiatica]